VGVRVFMAEVNEREKAIELAKYWTRYDATDLEPKELPHEWKLARALLKEVERSEELAKEQLCIHQRIIRREERIAELEAECEKLKDDMNCRGIHTCHENCGNWICVMRKERDTLRAENAVMRVALEAAEAELKACAESGHTRWLHTGLAITRALSSTAPNAVMKVVQAAEAYVSQDGIFQAEAYEWLKKALAELRGGK
jgi:hypothetical protein